MAWRCRLKGHLWIDRRDKDGDPYQVCERCGHYPGGSSWLAAHQPDRPPTDPTPGGGGANSGFGL